MKIVSLITRDDLSISFYSTESLRDYLSGFNFDTLFVGITPSEDKTGVIPDLLNNKNFLPDKKIVDVSVSSEEKTSLRKDLEHKTSTDVNFITKMHMIRMFTDTIYRYLQTSWKDFKSLESSETQTLFKARLTMLSLFVPQYSESFIFPILRKIKRNISEYGNAENSILLSDVEWSTWFRDNL